MSASRVTDKFCHATSLLQPEQQAAVCIEISSNNKAMRARAMSARAMRARAMRARAMRYELVAAYPTHRPPPAKKITPQRRHSVVQLYNLLKSRMKTYMHEITTMGSHEKGSISFTRLAFVGESH